jgi:predicted PolB exonuclease-like 3'-5' exonuclease
MNRVLFFDVETASQSDETLRHVWAVKLATSPEPEAEFEKIKREAALRPESGRVVAIGYAWDDQDPAVIDLCCTCDERTVLTAFWEIARKAETLVGFDSNRFDLPFLIRRSWALRVAVSPGFLPPRGFSGLPGFCVDLLSIYKLGDPEARISLDRLAKLLGVGEKTGNGGDFARLLGEDRKAAHHYLANDVCLTREVARVLAPELFPASPAKSQKT